MAEPWTPEELATLRRLAPQGSAAVALATGRPRTAVQQRACGLGIPLGRKPEQSRCDTLDKLLERVEFDTNGGCWLYSWSTDSVGYGHMSFGNRPIRAHRLAYTLAFGPPGALHVCHRCDTPACVRPDHLFLGTAKDNAADRTRKGRNNYPLGEARRGSKLTEAQVLEIRASPLGAIRLARVYGVGRTAIERVKTGRTWKHLKALEKTDG